MHNSEIDVFFSTDKNLIYIYDLFYNLNKKFNFNFLCVDIDTLTYFPNEIHDLISIYDLIIIYLSEGKYPCFTIRKNLFEDIYFKKCFSNILSDDYYYLIDQKTPGYVLVEYDINGTTGKTLNI